jgi:hypothetical protein
MADTPLLRALVTALHETLVQLPGIEKVTWHRHEDWNVGNEDNGAPRPIDAG